MTLPWSGTVTVLELVRTLAVVGVLVGAAFWIVLVGAVRVAGTTPATDEDETRKLPPPATWSLSPTTPGGMPVSSVGGVLRNTRAAADPAAPRLRPRMTSVPAGVTLRLAARSVAATPAGGATVTTPPGAVLLRVPIVSVLPAELPTRAKLPPASVTGPLN